MMNSFRKFRTLGRFFAKKTGKGGAKATGVAQEKKVTSEVFTLKSVENHVVS